jgi:hypothetical protein
MIKESCIRVDLEGCILFLVAQRGSLNCESIAGVRVILVPSNIIILGRVKFLKLMRVRNEGTEGPDPGYTYGTLPITEIKFYCSLMCVRTTP